MTQEEKELLLKDLSARLPYGIKFSWKGDKDCNIFTLEDIGSIMKYAIVEEGKILPYLRPMSSMTEEELDELLDCEDIDFDGKSELVKRAMLAFAEGDRLLSNALFSMQYAKTVDWLNAHHFDYRGLIEKGLALDCTDLNIY